MNRIHLSNLRKRIPNPIGLVPQDPFEERYLKILKSLVKDFNENKFRKIFSYLPEREFVWLFSKLRQDAELYKISDKDKQKEILSYYQK